MHDLFIFFRCDRAAFSTPAQAVDHQLIGDHVQLFHFFALYIFLPCFTEDPGKPCFIHLPADHFCSNADVPEQPRESALCFRVFVLAFDNELSERGDIEM
jgi:hypothetical protein